MAESVHAYLIEQEFKISHANLCANDTYSLQCCFQWDQSGSMVLPKLSRTLIVAGTLLLIVVYMLGVRPGTVCMCFSNTLFNLK